MVLDDAWNRTTLQTGHQGVLPVHVVALVLGVANCFLNAIICSAFHLNRNLFYKCQLYTFYAFAFTNFLSGLFTVPTLVNLFMHNNLNCPRWTIIIGSGFEIGLDRMRKILSLAIAVERLYAVCCPARYYLSDHCAFAKRVCMFGVLWSGADVCGMIAEDSLFKVRMHCVTTSSSGRIFHTYFLVSSIVLGVALLIAYSLFIIKLCLITETLSQTHSDVTASHIRENYREANSLTVMVVLSVILFSVLPCLLYFYDLIENKIVFMEAGPVITIGYHMYGCSSFFFYSWRHRDIRNAVTKTLRKTRFGDEPLSFKSTIEESNKSLRRKHIVLIALQAKRPLRVL